MQLRGGQLLLHLADVFRVDEVKQALARQLQLWGHNVGGQMFNVGETDVGGSAAARVGSRTGLKLRILETDSEMKRIFPRSQLTTNRKPSAAWRTDHNQH